MDLSLAASLSANKKGPSRALFIGDQGEVNGPFSTKPATVDFGRAGRSRQRTDRAIRASARTRTCPKHVPSNPSLSANAAAKSG